MEGVIEVIYVYDVGGMNRLESRLLKVDGPGVVKRGRSRMWWKNMMYLKWDGSVDVRVNGVMKYVVLL